MSKWAQLEKEAAPQYEIVRDKNNQPKKIDRADPARIAKAKQKLLDFKLTFRKEIAYSEFVFSHLEGKPAIPKGIDNNENNQRSNNINFN